ncbi:hypothetical protein [Priestia aryabhattai]
MHKDCPLTFDKFKELTMQNILSIEINAEMIIVEDVETGFTVRNGSNQEEILIDMQTVWVKYKETGDLNILSTFIKVQQSKVMMWNIRKKTFSEIRDNLIPLVRANTDSNKEVFPRTVAIDINNSFKAAVAYDTDSVSQILEKEMFPFLPESDEVMRVAINNLVNKGWGDEINCYEEDKFYFYTFYISESYLTHYQFFIKPIIDKKIGNCFFAFPTNNIAYAVKPKAEQDGSIVEAVSFLADQVEIKFSQAKDALSEDIIRYNNGEYELLTKN